MCFSLHAKRREKRCCLRLDQLMMRQDIWLFLFAFACTSACVDNEVQHHILIGVLVVNILLVCLVINWHFLTEFFAWPWEKYLIEKYSWKLGRIDFCWKDQKHLKYSIHYQCIVWLLAFYHPRFQPSQVEDELDFFASYQLDFHEIYHNFLRLWLTQNLPYIFYSFIVFHVKTVLKKS